MVSTLGGPTLDDLDGMLRQGGITIRPIETQGVEEVSLENEDGTSERFAVEHTNQLAKTGRVTLYNTRTGEPHDVDLNNVLKEMKQVHRDPAFPAFLKRPMFTTKKDSAPRYVVGVLLCPLNPGHPDYAKYEAMGASPCRKKTLPNPLAVQAHLRVKHPATYANIERQKAEEIQNEEREWRRWQMTHGTTTMAPAMPQAPVEPAPVVPEVVSPTGLAVTCAPCNLVIDGKDEEALKRNVQAHLSYQHPDMTELPTS